MIDFYFYFYFFKFVCNYFNYQLFFKLKIKDRGYALCLEKALDPHPYPLILTLRPSIVIIDKRFSEVRHYTYTNFTPNCHFSCQADEQLHSKQSPHACLFTSPTSSILCTYLHGHNCSRTELTKKIYSCILSWKYFFR